MYSMPVHKMFSAGCLLPQVSDKCRNVNPPIPERNERCRSLSELMLEMRIPCASGHAPKYLGKLVASFVSFYKVSILECILFFIACIFYVSLKIQDVCWKCCETSPENDISSRYQIY